MTDQKVAPGTIETEYDTYECVVVWDDQGCAEFGVDLDDALSRYCDNCGNDGLRAAARFKFRLPKLEPVQAATITIKPESVAMLPPLADE